MTEEKQQNPGGGRSSGELDAAGVSLADHSTTQRELCQAAAEIVARLLRGEDPQVDLGTLPGPFNKGAEAMRRADRGDRRRLYNELLAELGDGAAEFKAAVSAELRNLDVPDPERLYEMAGKAPRDSQEREDALTSFCRAVQGESEAVWGLWGDRARRDGWITKGDLIAGIKGARRKRKEQEREERRAARRDRPTHDELRDRYLELHNGHLAYSSGDFRKYDGGPWVLVPEEVISQGIVEVLEAYKEQGVEPTSSLLSSVRELVGIARFVDPSVWDADPDLLPLNNCILHIPTRQPREYCPSDRVTSRLPYDYDPSATAPTFLYALNSSIPEASLFFQEFCGYALTTDVRFEISVWLCGKGGSGKSTLLVGLEAMLGDRAGVLGLADIERNRFALSEVPGKTLLFATEQPTTYIAATHTINALISGERLQIDRKFKPPLVICPRAKIAWSLNELPVVGSATSGLFRRVRVIPFPPRPEEERDPQIKEQVKLEGAGILNWALDGLDRLRERGRFDVPPCVLRATQKFERTSDRAGLFLSEMCICGSPLRIQSALLYDGYRRWCSDNGLQFESAIKVAEQWEQVGLIRYRAAGRSFWRGAVLANTDTLRFVQSCCVVGGEHREQLGTLHTRYQDWCAAQVPKLTAVLVDSFEAQLRGAGLTKDTNDSLRVGLLCEGRTCAKCDRMSHPVAEDELSV